MYIVLTDQSANGLIRKPYNGTHDTVVPYNYAIRYSEVMPKAQLRLIDGENHGFTQTADSTAAYIAGWLKKYSR